MLILWWVLGCGNIDPPPATLSLPGVHAAGDFIVEDDGAALTIRWPTHPSTSIAVYLMALLVVGVLLYALYGAIGAFLGACGRVPARVAVVWVGSFLSLTLVLAGVFQSAMVSGQVLTLDRQAGRVYSETDRVGVLRSTCTAAPLTTVGLVYHPGYMVPLAAIELTGEGGDQCWSLGFGGTDDATLPTTVAVRDHLAAITGAAVAPTRWTLRWWP